MLNLPRLHSRQALAVAQGVAVALGSADVPADLLDGVADSEEHAIDLAFRINVARQMARLRQVARTQGIAGLFRS